MLTGQLTGQAQGGTCDLCAGSSSAGAAVAIIVDGAAAGLLDDAVVAPIFIIMTVVDTTNSKRHFTLRTVMDKSINKKREKGEQCLYLGI